MLNYFTLKVNIAMTIVISLFRIRNSLSFYDPMDLNLSWTFLVLKDVSCSLFFKFDTYNHIYKIKQKSKLRTNNLFKISHFFFV